VISRVFIDKTVIFCPAKILSTLPTRIFSHLLLVIFTFDRSQLRKMDPDQPNGGKRASADADDFARKRVKKGEESGDKHNPYLAHMHEDDSANGYGPLDGMKRHETTAQQAAKVEDLAINPFTGRAHSQQYFRILQTRRELPVHKQR
jgi:hypothetical protein